MSTHYAQFYGSLSTLLDFLTIGAAIGPHPQHSYCCVMDFVTKALSFSDVEKETIKAVASYSDEIVSEVNLLRTTPERYIRLLEARYESFLDEFTYKLPNELKRTSKEGKNGE
jgi:hypothetical protein